jgi:hypothetical protein
LANLLLLEPFCIDVRRPPPLDRIEADEEIGGGGGGGGSGI